MKRNVDAVVTKALNEQPARGDATGGSAIRKLVSYVLMGIGVLWLAVTGVCGSILLGEPSETRLSSQDIFYAWLLVGAAVLVGGVFLLVGWLLRTR